MEYYSVRDVERVLQLSRSTVRGLINVGFVKPERGPRREFRFSFHDLIVLRAARALIQARIPRKRIRRSLEDLRRHLPATLPLSGLSISAVGDRVVVRDGNRHWQADSGQYLLGLDVSIENGMLRMIEHPARAVGRAHAAGRESPGGREHAAARDRAAAHAGTRERAAKPAKDADTWFAEGLALENVDPRAALVAYEHCSTLDPDHVAAWINRGRLLHERGDIREAERVYRRAADHCGHDALLMFNLGVVLEDLGKPGAALEAYQTAIAENPNLADCHYNLARLYESLGQSQHAIRHLGQYRRLLSHRGH